MTECDLCQADGVTDDEESELEAEESELEDHWLSEEMSLSEGEASVQEPKR